MNMNTIYLYEKSKRIKSAESIKTEKIDSGTNFIRSSIAEFGPSH